MSQPQSARPDFNFWVHKGKLTWALGLAPFSWGLPLSITSFYPQSFVVGFLCFYLEVDWE